MANEKDFLALKKSVRRISTADHKDLEKILLNIFSSKYGQIRGQFCEGTANSLSADDNTINEFALSDSQLLLTFNDSHPNVICRILNDLSEENVSVTYAPMMLPIISFLLLYLSESEVKICSQKLLNDSSMMPTSTTDWNKFCNLLLQLGQRYATKAFKLVNTSQIIDRKQLSYWPYIVWTLPRSHLNRIITCYLTEGVKVIYRTGLLIWKECYRRHRMEIDSKNFKELLLKTAETIDKTYTPQQFLDRMFRIRNFSRKIVELKWNALPSQLEMGPWISPTVHRGFIAFNRTDKNPSQIVSTEELIDIIRHLKNTISQVCKPVLLFSSERDGYALRSFYNIAENYRETLILIETAKGETIGAFCSDHWSLKGRPDVNRFYGKGESFVFKMRPKPSSFYLWNKDIESVTSNMFQRATIDYLEIGGGSQGAAIHIDKDLNKGNSFPSSTFNSPILTPYSNQDFLVKSLELLGFEEVKD